MGPCPLCFLLVFAASLSDYRHQRVSGDKLHKNEDNIGTVLFEKSDCGKHCWSNEEFAILNSRRMFQDILPKVNVINCENEQYIALLMDYFHICLECVRKLSIGKTKHLMLKALADTMGGYLKVYILPMTRHSYYAGNIKYRNAKRLFELFDELKKFLHTNGDGWRTSNLVTIKHIKTPAIVVTPTKSPTACNGLVTYPSPINENNVRDYKQYNFKKKRLVHRRRKSMRRSAMGKRSGVESGSDSGGVTVPLPFLDDDVEPNSIALPFKTDNLQSLYSEKSAFALVKYYVASVKCIESKSPTKFALSRFSRDLNEWLRKFVTPHLEDDKWYPAFGGVLRVMASLKESGFAGDTNKDGSAGGEYQVMPKFITETLAKLPVDSGVRPLYKNRGDDTSDVLNFGSTELIVIALASALLVWLFVGLTLVCYRFLRRHSDDCGPCQSRTSPPVALFHEKEDYLSPSKNSRKAAADKLKEWWNSRFGRCPGGCDRYEDEERCLAAMSYTSKDTLVASNSSKSVQKRRYNKSVLISRSASPHERRSFKRISYTSDESSTNSDRPTKSRIGTTTGEE